MIANMSITQNWREKKPIIYNIIIIILLLLLLNIKYNFNYKKTLGKVVTKLKNILKVS
jgi:hypothetical protein